MDTDKILSELRAERTRIEQAIAALESLNSIARPMRRRGSAANSRAGFKKRSRGRMSAAARKKLSQLMKQRWAQGRMKSKKKTA